MGLTKSLGDLNRTKRLSQREVLLPWTHPKCGSSGVWSLLALGRKSQPWVSWSSGLRTCCTHIMGLLQPLSLCSLGSQPRITDLFVHTRAGVRTCAHTHICCWFCLSEDHISHSGIVLFASGPPKGSASLAISPLFPSVGLLPWRRVAGKSSSTSTCGDFTPA